MRQQPTTNNQQEKQKTKTKDIKAKCLCAYEALFAGVYVRLCTRVNLNESVCMQVYVRTSACVASVSGQKALDVIIFVYFDRIFYFYL
jgi:hypothetical protein